MNVVLTQKNCGGEVKILSSKSELHRLLILSAVSKGESTKITYYGEPSQDVLATVSCLRQIGAKIEVLDNAFIVTPIKQIPKKPVSVCPNESGSTLRFILPVFSALGINYVVTVNGRLSERPLSPLYELMTENGVKLSTNGVYPLTVSGKLQKNDYEISGEISSQFISGLLMALPLVGGGKVKVTGDFQSKPYVDITLDAMRKFGVIVKENDNKYIVEDQFYLSKGTVNAGGDWSNAAFFLSLGAINGKISVTNLDMDSLQGDKQILDVLKSFGAKITIENDRVAVEKDQLKGINVDVKNIPDLVPIISVVGAVTKGQTTIYNGERLRIKESDRIKSVVDMISAVGGDIVEMDDGMIINGKPLLKGGDILSFNDHRIVMSGSILSAVCENPVVIKNAQAVNKSYPQFFEEIKNLGFNVKEI